MMPGRDYSTPRTRVHGAAGITRRFGYGVMLFIDKPLMDLLPSDTCSDLPRRCKPCEVVSLSLWLVAATVVPVLRHAMVSRTGEECAVPTVIFSCFREVPSPHNLLLLQFSTALSPVFCCTDLSSQKFRFQ